MFLGEVESLMGWGCTKPVLIKALVILLPKTNLLQVYPWFYPN